MFYNPYESVSDCELITLIEDMSVGCDLEFDNVYDDLEREFAVRRLQHGNE